MDTNTFIMNKKKPYIAPSVTFIKMENEEFICTSHVNKITIEDEKELEEIDIIEGMPEDFEGGGNSKSSPFSGGWEL